MLARYGAPPGHRAEFTSAGAEHVLPAPLAGSLDQPLAARRSCRNFDPERPLEIAALSTALWKTFGALGTLSMAPGVEVVKKHAPAG